MLRYRLIPVASRDEDYEGSAFERLRLDRWTFELNTTYVEPGATVDVVIEQASSDDEDEWEAVYTFNVSAQGRQTAFSFDQNENQTTDSDEFAFGAPDTHFRAVTQNHAGGEIVLSLFAEARVFDPVNLTADSDLLSKETAGWTSELPRLSRLAERTVLSFYRPTEAGAIGVDERPDFPDILREMIARQTDWISRKEKLARSTDAAALKTLRSMSVLAPDVREILETSAESNLEEVIWLHR